MGRILLALLLAAAPLPALAHVREGDRLGPPGWTFDAWVTVPLALSLLLYSAGSLRLAARATQPGPQRRGRAFFYAGWTLLAAAVVSPLHEAGERSFAAHMLEHELMMLVAAPLLVLSRPLGPMLWAFPAALRPRVAALGRSRAVGMPWSLLTGAVAATLLQTLVLWGWHAPRAFDLALAVPGWHVAQHVSFLVSALLFWYAMLCGPRRRDGLAVGCLFFTATTSGALGALMAFSDSPWYAGYAGLGLDAFGLTAAEDQQLAGLLMWVPGGLVHALAGVALLARGLVDAPGARALPALALLAAGLGVTGRAAAETVYVSDEQAHVVHVLRGPDWHVAAAIPVGKRPRGLELSRDGRLLYVAVSDDNRIDIVDLAARRVIGHLPSGPDPERFVLSPDGRRMYVANEDDAKVSVLDVASRRVLGEVDVGGEPEGMAVSPDGRWVICTSEAASLVHFIDAAAMKLVDSVMVGTRPRDAAFSRDGRWLWVTSELRGTANVFDMATRKRVRVIDFDRDPGAPDSMQAVGIALAPDDSRAFIAMGRGNHVAEVEPASGRILRYYPVGSRTWGVALSRDGRRVYAAAGLSGDVTVLDVEAKRPLKTIRTGGRPWGVVVGP